MLKVVTSIHKTICKLRSFTVKYILAVIIILLPVISAFAADEAVFWQDRDDGSYLIHNKGVQGITVPPGQTDDPSVIWHRYLEWPIFTTTANCGDGYVFTGTWLNDPRQAELLSAGGFGVPEWIYTGYEFYVDGSCDGFTLAGADGDSSGVNIVKWTGPGNGAPDWTAYFPSANISSYGPYILVSDDGTTVAAALNQSPETRLVVFDQGSSIPIVNYLTEGLGFPRSSQITSDGRFFGARVHASVLVYDVDNNAVREVISAGYSSTPFDISGDGDLIAYSWTNLTVRQWDGTSYANYWTRSEAGYYMRCASISDDGSTIAAGWNNTSYNTARLTVHQSGSAVPIWTYNYPTSSGSVQEVISDIEMTPDGQYIVVGSWGDANNINPEVHVFDRDAGAVPYYTVDMPGSVFSVDISDDGRYASACGKHIHANISGHGGDIKMIDLDLTAPQLDVTLTPYGAPIQIPSGGGSFDFNISVRNLAATQASFDVWTQCRLPSGSFVGPIIGPVALTVPGGAFLERDRTQAIPATAPSGIYYYEAYAGDYPDEYYSIDSFTFEKMGDDDGGFAGSLSDWPCYGESFTDEDIHAAALPLSYLILSAYPNPMNLETNLTFNLPEAADVSLIIYDVQGREISTLMQGWQNAGRHHLKWDASGLASGIYFAKLQAGTENTMQKLLLLK